MTWEFTHWFCLGFAIYLMQLVGLVVMHIVQVCCNVLSKGHHKTQGLLVIISQYIAGALLSVSMGLGKMWWLIAGQVYRFRIQGKLCSGDFLEDDEPELGYLMNTGKFMTTWIFLEYGICVACYFIAFTSDTQTTLD